MNKKKKKKKKKEYDLFIPVNFNSGLPIGLDKLRQIRDNLINKFHGITVFAPCDGSWKDGSRVYEDRNYIFRVVADDNAEVRSFMLNLKSCLQVLLEQESVFIIVRDVEIL